MPFRSPVLTAVATALLVVGSVGASAAATLSGKISAGSTVQAPAPLSVAIDAWVCGKDGSIEDPSLVIGRDRGLANVVVHVVGVPEPRPFPAGGEHVIDQRSCVFEPHVTLVAPGEAVVVRNDDGVLHNFHTQSVKNRSINRAQPNGKVDTFRFSEPETIRVECDVHYWMSAVVVVAADAYVAVTARDGTFSIDGLPPGSYRADLWHEKLGTNDVAVEIGQDGGRLTWSWDAPPAAKAPATEPATEP